MPQFRGRTNGDLLEYILELRIAVKECSIDKATIRRWSAEQK